MFEKILKSKIKITDTLYLRYDIQAMILAEQQGIDIFDIYKNIVDPKKALALLKIGLGNCFAQCKIPKSRQAQIVNSLIASVGIADIAVNIQAALIMALPVPVIGADTSDGDKDFSKLYGLFVDIMGHTEQEFFELTIREVLDRWDNYAVFNGYKKPVTQFKRYADE